MTPPYRSLLDSPIGWLIIEANDHAITRIAWCDDVSPPEPNASELTQTASAQLHDYFNGQRQQFNLPLAPIGTEFQQRCWQALCVIPYGATRSYADQAQAIAHPQSVRAVGQANGANPIAIVIPCHRVIGANGRLTGYTGGLNRKRWLLACEHTPQHETASHP